MNENGDTLLHQAVRFNHVKLLRTLLDNGVDPNVLNNTGESALYLIYNDCGLRGFMGNDVYETDSSYRLVKKRQDMRIRQHNILFQVSRRVVSCITTYGSNCLIASMDCGFFDLSDAIVGWTILNADLDESVSSGVVDEVKE